MRARVLVLAALIAWVGGCSNGKSDSKGSYFSGVFGGPDHARVDPDYRYRRAWLTWQGDHDSIVEGMDAGSTLQINDAYKGAKAALLTLRKYVAQSDQDQVDGFVAQYDKIYGYLSMGNYNSGIHSMLDSLKDKIDKSLSPSVVQIVIPEGERDTAAAEPPRPVPEKKTAAEITPDIGAPQARPGYAQAWEGWQRVSGDLMERLYTSAPKVDDLRPRILAAIDALSATLPNKAKEGPLADLRRQYDALLAQIQSQGVDKGTVESVALLQRLMESDFAPDKVAPPEPKGPTMGAPQKNR